MTTSVSSPKAPFNTTSGLPVVGYRVVARRPDGVLEIERVKEDPYGGGTMIPAQMNVAIHKRGEKVDERGVKTDHFYMHRHPIPYESGNDLSTLYDRLSDNVDKVYAWLQENRFKRKIAMLDMGGDALLAGFGALGFVPLVRENTGIVIATSAIALWGLGKGLKDVFDTVRSHQTVRKLEPLIDQNRRDRQVVAKALVAHGIQPS